MINVVCDMSNESEYELTIQGHAGYSENGNDIVCAGASAIAYTLLGYLNNCDDVIDLEYADRSGDFSLVCSGDSVRVQTAFEMALIGFMQLESTYPQCVRVEKL